MAYNKAREEKKWLEWKEKEETKLNRLGFSQDKIEMLRQYDLEIFNSDRRYYQRLNDNSTYDLPSLRAAVRGVLSQCQAGKPLHRHDPRLSVHGRSEICPHRQHEERSPSQGHGRASGVAEGL